MGERDLELEDMEDRLRAVQAPVPSTPTSIYNPTKGDTVDEYLAKYINMMQCQVPIKRLGNGYYLFGTRKIFAKIMNGKLVIRVGGGYMVIEEFIATYADQEINRCKLLDAQQQMNQQLEGIPTEGRRGATAKNKSPRGSLLTGSPRPGGYSKITLGK